MTKQEEEAIQWFLQIAKSERFRIVTEVVSRSAKSSPVSEMAHIMHYKSGRNDGIDEAMSRLMGAESFVVAESAQNPNITSHHPDLDNES